MIEKTPTLALQKPDENEFYSVHVQNSNADKIDAEAAAIRAQFKANKEWVMAQLQGMSMDGGSFEDNPVAAHSADEYAHPNMLADGGDLEAHMNDRQAHQNIVLDGNIN